MTEKWNDEWFLKLTPYEKLLWNFLCDNCDIAGFWEINLTLSSLLTGISFEDTQGAYKGLARGYLESGRFIWLRNFIKHQKNLPLNAENRCHKAILRSISEHKSLEKEVLEVLRKQTDELNIEGACKGLTSPLGKGKGKGKGINTKGSCIFFDANFLLQGIADEDKTEWSTAYPAVDIELSIKQAEQWLKSNPTKTKSNYRRFLTNWFSREQEKGGNKNGTNKGFTKKPETVGGNNITGHLGYR